MAATTAQPAATRRRRTSLRTVVAVVAVVAAMRLVAVEPLRVASDSMRPTLDSSDVVLVDKIGPRVAGVGRGDLVTFQGEDGRLALKRVVGVAGDRVAIRDAVLYVGTRPVREPYVDYSRIDGVFYGPVTVPDGHVLVLGDNRGSSVDSRAYGPVPVERLRGRVVLGLWPPRWSPG